MEMKGKSPYNYVKTVYLSDLFKAVIKRLPILILVMILAFLASFVPGFLSGQKAKSEAPCYSYSASIKVDSDFDSNSILNCAAVAFSDENLEKLIQYEKFDIEVDELRKSMTYNSEAKGMIRLTIYTKDEETAKRFMDGAKYINIPIMAEEADARNWTYSFVSAPQQVKVDIYTSDGEPGFAPVKNAHIQAWDEYQAEKTGVFHLAKNAMVLTVSVGFIAAVLIMLARVMSRKLVTVSDVEAAAGMPVTAAVGRTGSGIEFLGKMIGEAAAGSGKLSLIPVKAPGAGVDAEELAKKLSALSGAEVEITEAVSDKPDAAFGKDPAMLLIEDEKLTDIELINALELLGNAGRKVSGIALFGVNEKKLGRGKDYFGKYYRDKGKTE